MACIPHAMRANASDHCLYRTGWSALYDESSEEEEPPGLQAEQSQASSLSFQPHNLFKEHFAAGASAATPNVAADKSLTSLMYASSPPRPVLATDSAAQPNSSSQHPASKLGLTASKVEAAALNGLQEPLGALQTQNSYSPKVRKCWGLDAESAVKPEAACASSSPRLGQSPAGKPPLPRQAGKGALLPGGPGKSPRLSSIGARSPAASRGQPLPATRSPAADPMLPSGVRLSPASSPAGSRPIPALPLAGLVRGAQSAEDGSAATCQTPCTPAVRCHKLLRVAHMYIEASASCLCITRTA